MCPLVEAAISGFNSTIFAYGQTSSGKTFTMYGTDQEDGIINMAVENLFYAIEESPDRRFLMQVGRLFISLYSFIYFVIFGDLIHICLSMKE